MEPNHSTAQPSNQLSDQEEQLLDAQAVPELNAPFSQRTSLSKVAIGFISLVFIVLLIAINGGFSHGKQDNQNNGHGKEIGNNLGAPPNPSTDPDAQDDKDNPDNDEKDDKLHTGLNGMDSPSYSSVNSNSGQRKQWTPRERKQWDDILVVNRNSQSAARTQTVSSESPSTIGKIEQPNELSQQLQATKFKGSRASIVADSNLFLTKGAFLDCILETAISSDVPGMTRCQLSRDIYSTNGKVLLLEKGSHIVGQYQGGIQQGQARIFVLWDRVQTPNGVIIDLDSPGTDTLGRSGHSGFIDGHFKERFGSAILLSLIGDVGSYAANSANKGNKNQIQFGDTIGSSKDMANIVLQNSIHIKPTLLKNQGEHINVFVARDLDFRSVYDLQLTQ